MVASREPRSYRLGRAIRQKHAAVIPEHRVPHRRFNADARGASGEHEILDAKPLEDCIKVGSMKATVTMFGDNDVSCLRFQFAQNLGVPRILNQDPAFRAVRRGDTLSDAPKAYA